MTASEDHWIDVSLIFIFHSSLRHNPGHSLLLSFNPDSRIGQWLSSVLESPFGNCLSPSGILTLRGGSESRLSLLDSLRDGI